MLSNKDWKINLIAISVPLLIGIIWIGINQPIETVVGVDCVRSPYETRMSIVLGDKQKFDMLKKIFYVNRVKKRKRTLNKKETIRLHTE